MNFPKETHETPPYGAYGLDARGKLLLKFSQSRKRTWLGRRLALIARRLVLGKRKLPIDANAEGFCLRTHVTDNVSERKYLFMPQFVDPAERAYMVGHLTPDGVFLDIGANAGIYTLSAARTYLGFGRSGRVLAIEANPIMQERLEYNIAINNLNEQVHVVPMALSDRNGEVAFSISGTNLGESGLLGDHSSTMMLPCRTLTNVLEEHSVGRVDGMKIDVEGMEDVILGHFFAHAPFEQFPRFIIIENSADKWRTDLFGLLESLGYILVSKEKMNSIFVLPQQKTV